MDATSPVSHTQNQAIINKILQAKKKRTPKQSITNIKPTSIKELLGSTERSTTYSRSTLPLIIDNPELISLRGVIKRKDTTQDVTNSSSKKSPRIVIRKASNSPVISDRISARKSSMRKRTSKLFSFLHGKLSVADDEKDRNIYYDLVVEVREAFRKRQRKLAIDRMKEVVYVAATERDSNAVSAAFFIMALIEYFFRDYTAACEYLINLVTSFDDIVLLEKSGTSLTAV